MLAAELAVLFQLKPLLQSLLVLPGILVDPLALGAFQLDQIIL